MWDQKTRESLGIFWNAGDGHVETDGLLIYGYWPEKPSLYPRFPLGLWPKGTEWSSLEYVPIEEGETWRVNQWEVKIEQWPKPEEWQDLLKKTLQVNIEGGATVAFCGILGHFADPPALFDPKHMPDGVWAALDKTGRFLCTAELDERIKFFSDEQMADLRRFL